MLFRKLSSNKLYFFYINPIDPAVKPTIKKKENSNKSRGKELTSKFN